VNVAFESQRIHAAIAAGQFTRAAKAAAYAAEARSVTKGQAADFLLLAAELWTAEHDAVRLPYTKSEASDLLAPVREAIKEGQYGLASREAARLAGDPRVPAAMRADFLQFARDLRDASLPTPMLPNTPTTKVSKAMPPKDEELPRARSLQDREQQGADDLHNHIAGAFNAAKRHHRHVSFDMPKQRLRVSTKLDEARRSDV